MITKEKPKVFIASSGDAIEYADAVKAKLDKSNIIAETWQTDELYKNSTYLNEWLNNIASHYDFGVFIFNNDDFIRLKDEEAFVVRDNVLFELGLFSGRLGYDRCFPIVSNCKAFHLPSDLHGVIVEKFDMNNTNIASAVNTACYNISTKIKAKWDQVLKDSSFLQIGGVVYKIEKSEISFLLTKTNSDRWVFPKKTPSRIEDDETALNEALKTEGFVRKVSDVEKLENIKYYKEANKLNRSAAKLSGIPDSTITTINNKQYYTYELRPYLVRFEEHEEDFDINSDTVIWCNFRDTISRLSENREVGKDELWELFSKAYLKISNKLISTK